MEFEYGREISVPFISLLTTMVSVTRSNHCISAGQPIALWADLYALARSAVPSRQQIILALVIHKPYLDPCVI